MTHPDDAGSVRPDDTRTSTASSADPVAARPRRMLLFVLVAVVVLALDATSKALVVARLPQIGVPRRELAGAVYVEQVRNSGAAFSLGTGFTVVLTGLAVAVVVLIVRFASRLRSRGWAVALGLILGGALGNLADRLFRSPGVGRGHVVDWISLFGPDGRYWPVFNLADSGIVCGAVLAGLLAVVGVDFDGGRGSRSGRA